MKTLVLGGGSIGKRHVSNILREFPNSKVQLITKFSDKNHQLFKDKRITLKSSLNKEEFFDLVYIATPASKHISDLNSLNRKCKKILIEKPLFNGFEKNNIPITNIYYERLLIGYILRFDPIIYKSREIINSGKLGDLLYGRVWAGQYLPDWRPEIDYRKSVSAQKKLGGGPLHELSHEIDYVTYLLNEKPNAVLCSLKNLSSLDIDTEDYCSLQLEFGKKIINFDLDFIAQPAKLGFCLYFELGTIEADFVNRELKVSFNKKVQNYNVAVSSFNSLYVDQLHYLNNSLAKSKMKSISPANLEDAILTMKIIQSSLKSNRISSWVEI